MQFNIIHKIPIIYEYLDETHRAILKFVNREFYDTVTTIAEIYVLPCTNIYFRSVINGSNDLVSFVQKNISPLTFVSKLAEVCDIPTINTYLTNELCNIIYDFPLTVANSAAKNSVTVMKFLQNTFGLNVSYGACISAAKVGNLDVIIYLLQHLHKCTSECIRAKQCELLHGFDIRSVFFYALQRGHINCVKYLHEQHNYRYDDFPIDACSVASRYNQLDCLIYLCDYGYKLSVMAIEKAVMYGSLECLLYMYSKGMRGGANICTIAAEHGQIACLKYLHSNGHKIDVEVIEASARYGHTDCLKYALQCSHDIGRALIMACGSGNIECLKYLHQNGYKLNKHLYRVALANNKHMCAEYVKSKVDLVQLVNN